MSNISLMSCPEDPPEPCGVKQSTYTHAVSVTVFIFDTWDFIQSNFVVKFIGWMWVILVRMQIPEMKASVPVT